MILMMENVLLKMHVNVKIKFFRFLLTIITKSYRWLMKSADDEDMHHYRKRLISIERMHSKLDEMELALKS